MIQDDAKSKIVSQIILEQKGRFTVEDIVKSVVQQIKESVDNIRLYILKKLESMCEYGLIGKTDIYYFSV